MTDFEEITGEQKKNEERRGCGDGGSPRTCISHAITFGERSVWLGSLRDCFHCRRPRRAALLVLPPRAPRALASGVHYAISSLQPTRSEIGEQ